MKKLLSLSYKGDRNYLHGSDIFEALADIATELTGADGAFVERLAFRRFSRMACEISSAPPAESSQTVGQARFRLPGASSLEAWLIETDIPVTSRRPFDEASLLANASLDVDGRCASLPERTLFSPIEEVIALTKYLNYAVCPEVNGKWLFGQVDLNGPLTGNHRELEIQMKNLIAGRFSVNEINVDGRSVGTMRFIVGAP